MHVIAENEQLLNELHIVQMDLIAAKDTIGLESQSWYSLEVEGPTDMGEVHWCVSIGAETDRSIDFASYGVPFESRHFDTVEEAMEAIRIRLEQQHQDEIVRLDALLQARGGEW